MVDLSVKDRIAEQRERERDTCLEQERPCDGGFLTVFLRRRDSVPRFRASPKSRFGFFAVF